MAEREIKGESAEELIEEVRPSHESRGLPAPLAEGKEAFYRGDFEAAVRQFEAVLADSSYDQDSRATAAYYRAEAMLEQNYSKEIIAQFEAVAAEFPDHYLGAAAQRRAEALKRYFEEIERSYQEG